MCSKCIGCQQTVTAVENIGGGPRERRLGPPKTCMTEQQQYMTLPCALAELRQHARVGVPVARTYTPPNIFPNFFNFISAL
jgi:hypothetical protein